MIFYHIKTGAKCAVFLNGDGVYRVEIAGPLKLSFLIDRKNLAENFVSVKKKKPKPREVAVYER